MGHIQFLNCLPVFWGLSRQGSLGDFDLRRGTPEVLTRSLLAGELDISPVTLFEFLKHSDELVVLPDMAIGCDGPVMSCLIVSRVPLRELDGAPLALASTSRTSTKLAELLLNEVVGVRPEPFRCPPDLRLMMKQAPAGVIIGDPALAAATRDARELGLEVHDLGQMWQDWTGLPFVFALFAARRPFAQRDPEVVRRSHGELRAAWDLGLREVDAVCEQAARWEDFSAATLREYYTSALDFSLGERQLAGVARFAQKLQARGELPSEVRLHLFDGPQLDLGATPARAAAAGAFAQRG